MLTYFHPTVPRVEWALTFDGAVRQDPRRGSPTAGFAAVLWTCQGDQPAQVDQATGRVDDTIPILEAEALGLAAGVQLLERHVQVGHAIRVCGDARPIVRYGAGT
eukprot:2374111-Prorocentrum_lima.AAC.1